MFDDSNFMNRFAGPQNFEDIKLSESVVYDEEEKQVEEESL